MITHPHTHARAHTRTYTHTHTHTHLQPPCTHTHPDPEQPSCPRTLLSTPCKLKEADTHKHTQQNCTHAHTHAHTHTTHLIRSLPPRGTCGLHVCGGLLCVWLKKNVSNEGNGELMDR